MITLQPERCHVIRVLCVYDIVRMIIKKSAKYKLFLIFWLQNMKNEEMSTIVVMNLVSTSPLLTAAANLY